MAISRIGSVWAEGTSVTMPTHAVGDLLITFAYRDGSTTAPTLATGWTTIQSGGANTNSAIAAYKFATSTTDGSDTWTNATEVVAVIYRGTSSLLPIGNSTQNGAASTTIDYPTTTLASAAGTSWVVGFAGHRSINVSITTPPTGMTNFAGGDGATAAAAGADTNGPVSSWSDQTVNVGGTSSGWRSMVIEILAPTTTLFLHQTTTISHPSSIDSGSKSTALPAGTDHSPTATTAMDMDSNIGSSQTSRTSTTGTVATLTSARVGTWVSNPLNVSSIDAQNWTVGFGYQENNANANQFMAFSIYVLKSDGTVRGYIYDSATALSTEFTTAEQGRSATVAGSAVSGVQNTDQLCVEIWATGTQTLTTSRTITYYWDGGTLVSDGVATSDAAAFVHTGEQAISFYVNTPPTVALNSPSNGGTVSTTTPTLNFTGTDADGNTISYEVEVDTVNTFNSQTATITRDTTHEPTTNPFTTTSNNFTTKQTGSAFTPQANAAIFVVVGLASINGGGTPAATVTDSVGNTYTLLISNATTATDLISVYWFYYTNSPGSITVSVQSTNTNPGGMFEVLNYLGVASTQTGNTVAVNRSTAGTLQGSLTVGSSNIAIGGAANFTDATVLAALANSTIAGHFENATTGDSYSSFTSTTTGTNTYGYSTSKVGGFAAVEVQIGTNSPLINAFSAASTGFADATNPGDSDPFPSGDTINYTVQAGSSLTNTDMYYWRVRAIDPSGSDTFGSWSSIYSFTVSTGGAAPTNLFFQFFSWP